MSAEEVPLHPIHKAAIQLGMKGYKLIRVKPGSKVPMDPRWTEIATNDAVTIDEWFTDGDCNIGLACGMQPNGRNIVVVDIDPKNGGRESWRALVNEHGKIGGPRHVTPHEGWHLPLVFPAGFRNSRNLLGPGIDTRGEGGQVLVPPSTIIEPTTGEILTYGAEPGRGLLAMDPIEAPEWLIERLSAPLPEVRQSQQRHPSNRGSTWNNDETPLDFLRRTLDPVEVMVGYGWAVHSHRGGDTYLTRPGKDPREGQSAIVHADGAIVVFTTTNVEHLIQRPTSDGTGIKMSLAEFIAGHETRGSLRELSSVVRRELMPQRPIVAVGGDGELPDERDDEPWANSWTEDVDMAAVLAGESTGPEPTVLVRADGVGLFYPGKMALVYGDSGRGKGWVVLVALAQEIMAGRNVMYLDLEDTSISIGNRLRILGVPDTLISKHLTYRHPSDPADPEAIEAVIRVITEREISIVVIDSLGEAFALDGVNENVDAEVGPWISRVARRISHHTGATVILVDHSTKSQEHRLHPSGSKRKRAAVEVAYLVEPLRDLTKGRGGAVKLITAKDKHGTHVVNRPAAIITFIPSGEGMRPVVSPVSEDQFQPESPVETHDRQITERQQEVLGQARRLERDIKRPWTRTRLADYVGGKATTTREAVNRLVEHGHFIEVGMYKNSPTYRVSEDAPATKYDS